MKNLSKLAVYAAVLFGMCSANGMLEIRHCENIQMNQQPPKVQENKAEADSGGVQDQAKNQAEDQENALIHINSIPPLDDNPLREKNLSYYQSQLNYNETILNDLIRLNSNSPDENIEAAIQTQKKTVEIYRLCISKLTDSSEHPNTPAKNK